MTYSLSNLMLFWELESKCDFATIKKVLQIASSENIPPADKEKLILRELRDYLLYEEEYTLSPEQKEMNEFAFAMLTNLNNRPKS